MDLTWTLVLAGGALATAVLCGWLGARPARLLRHPRLVPWRFLMLLAVVVAIAALVHAVALLRAATGSSPS